MARKNTPSHKRIASPPPFRLTERDQSQVIQSVYTHRVLTSQQIEVLHFSSNSREETRTLRS